MQTRSAMVHNREEFHYRHSHCFIAAPAGKTFSCNIPLVNPAVSIYAYYDGRHGIDSIAEQVLETVIGIFCHFAFSYIPHGFDDTRNVAPAIA